MPGPDFNAIIEELLEFFCMGFHREIYRKHLKTAVSYILFVPYLHSVGLEQRPLSLTCRPLLSEGVEGLKKSTIYKFRNIMIKVDDP